MKKKFYVTYAFRLTFEWHFQDAEYEAEKFIPNEFKGWVADTFEHANKASKLIILYVQEL